MTPDIFAEWLKRQNHKIFMTESSYWVNLGTRALQAFPYHWLITPSKKELNDLLKNSMSLLLRYSTPVNSNEGKISYHASYCSKIYSIDNLGKWSRKNVRRGLNNCEVKKISFERLAEEGFELQLDTLSRQGRNLKLSNVEWKRRCLSAVDLPGFDAWGAIVDDRLAATVITFQMGDCGYMLYQQCHRNYLEEHVNNALSFIVTSELLSKSSISSILYGLHSLDAPSSVDEFKFRMGYEAKPVRQRVVVNPKIAPLFNNFTYSGLRSVHKFLPDNPTLSKAEGMYRFYLQGKRPLAEQNWPEVLLEQKESILAQASQS